MKTRHKKEIDSHGHAYLLLVLLNILALREVYMGNESWWLVQLITIPLLLLYAVSIRYLNKADKK